jgi:predicted nucleic acid-binding protein
MKVIDTTVAIDHLRGIDAATDLLAGVLAAGDRLVASELVRYELLAGARPHEAASIEAFCTSLTWVPVDEQVARTAALLAARYHRSHGGIDTGDYVIAATALALDAQLLTTNVRHFPMFAGLSAPY